MKLHTGRQCGTPYLIVWPTNCPQSAPFGNLICRNNQTFMKGDFTGFPNFELQFCLWTVNFTVKSFQDIIVSYYACIKCTNQYTLSKNVYFIRMKLNFCDVMFLLLLLLFCFQKKHRKQRIKTGFKFESILHEHHFQI